MNEAKELAIKTRDNINSLFKAVDYANETIGYGATVADVQVYVAEKIEEIRQDAYENEDTLMSQDYAKLALDDELKALNKHVEDGSFQEEITINDWLGNQIHVEVDDICIGYGGPSIRLDWEGCVSVTTNPLEDAQQVYVNRDVTNFLAEYHDECFGNEIKQAREAAEAVAPLLSGDYVDVWTDVSTRVEYEKFAEDMKTELADLQNPKLSNDEVECGDNDERNWKISDLQVAIHAVEQCELEIYRPDLSRSTPRI